MVILLNIINCQNRFTRVVTKKGSSSWKLQSQGLPQGSSLSPILYILFTNDFKIKYTQFIRMGCFADDSSIWTIPSSVGNLKYDLLQRELSRFTDWTKYWNMSINPDKCSVIKLHNRKHINLYYKYKIDDKELKYVPNCKYLGLWLDTTLSLKTHINKTKQKLQQSLYHFHILKHCGIKLFPKTKIQIYKTKQVIFEYA